MDKIRRNQTPPNEIATHMRTATIDNLHRRIQQCFSDPKLRMTDYFNGNQKKISNDRHKQNARGWSFERQNPLYQASKFNFK